ncbi:peptidase domain-containing ABC transporter [Chryseobacterium polytrichastri]|uniref:Colicin V processing peptidase. Cysteine peptidase. MEROPS family C39 /alpha-hemolysin translocation ATP-binding protein HlyB n=1 Tax=Chryseobacterium polytrichastri TaxID=1302687 RepID=A0A1M6X2F4_9FLAO|nr:peptidase domain-containing ABC transporter [Chryseobacterium polytrichastri]SHL00104.1 colicin V processing peptidase. Cysteine peptidase. MEROPS family C39 /alpha-hemolysin translocation ATP-binding protein HlyB [Chryseobacterium polytrichastri]
MKKFPFYKQPDAKDCGPTCLRIVSKYYGKTINLQQIRDLAQTTRIGSSLLNLGTAAEKLGFRSRGVKVNFRVLAESIQLPCIVHWDKRHFVVVYNIKKQGREETVYVSDPSYGLLTFKKKEFIKRWIGNNANENSQEGIALLLETTPFFYEVEWDEKKKKLDIKFLSRYAFKYKALIFQLGVGLLTGSLLSLILPFLTQSIVDVGIQNNDINFIYLILIAQFMLYLGRMGVEIVRSWILLHLSSRINISLVSDFFIKLMRLPISYFDTRMTGDLLQRIGDHSRIQQLLTSSTLTTLFSVFNFFIYSIILLFYDYRLFLVFCIGAVLYTVWVLFFLKKRKELDYKNFSQLSETQSKVIELINGMQEIKMNNAEQKKRWAWESTQVQIFKLNIQGLKLDQWQSIGGSFINQMKDMVISFLSAKLVVDGDITLGMMMSIQYIIGQLNGPIGQVVSFVKQLQDASISLERLNEIHEKDNEEIDAEHYLDEAPQGDIVISNLTYKYVGGYKNIFENLNLTIPYRKTTAIVGVSGSGKSTLVKLLLKFYEPQQGGIKIGSADFKRISPRIWRENVGIVMQDGYIFNDTIADNIAVGDDNIDKAKLRHAVEVANIKEFIDTMPLGYNTKIGNEGMGISGGQKQRLFIARAIYKAPDFIFFDEATSSLDANNEKAIIDNLNQFFKGRTAVIVAHRLSTVKNADKIVVLDNGKVIEEGSHAELVKLKGAYFKLIKNQLELD